MDFILVLDIIAWVLTSVGYLLNYLNKKNYTEDKNRAALICFGTAFVLFMLALFLLLFVSI